MHDCMYAWQNKSFKSKNHATIHPYNHARDKNKGVGYV